MFFQDKILVQLMEQNRRPAKYQLLPPPLHVHKCDTDASRIHSIRCTYIVTFVGTVNGPTCRVSLLETVLLLLQKHWRFKKQSWKRNLEDIIVESDSQVAILYITHQIGVPRQIPSMVEYTGNVSRNIKNIKFSYCIGLPIL